MSEFNIIKTDKGRYALLVNGQMIADYTRKADAKRGYARYLARTRTDDVVQPSVSEQHAHKPQAETPLNTVCRVAGEALYLIGMAKDLLSAVEPGKGVVRTPALTQRTSVRGTARAAARSPPGLIGGERLITPCSI